MATLTGAIYARLADDAPIVAALRSYRGQPGIFSSRPVPEDAEVPYVLIEGAIAETPRDSLGGERHATRLIEVRLYAPATGGDKAVDVTAKRIRDSLHQAPLEIDDWIVQRAVAEGPVQIPATGRLIGRLIELRVDLQHL